jgi:hypothetical protein
MKANNLHKIKTIKKPGLTPSMKEARLQFCLRYQNWTLKDWKAVIWSDETSVVLGERRGSQRVWRTPGEMHHPDVIHRRWKGFSEFMFWACFSYDKKGPCHIWKKETEKEKKEAQKHIDRWNRGNEDRLKEEWELANGLRRVNLARQSAGKKPVWKFNEQNGKRMRKNKKGGID